ncbi:MAG: DUF1501 domain-containing protein [Fuerstiella sp.]|nr:DUF1501 domain-containing protein [Fuerstiella sp.]MCP4854896.1 DUF1501 domain-containing protein [Fuerstiella sp.]
MKRLHRAPPQNVTRRQTLQVGMGMFGVGLPQHLQAAATGGTKDVSSIFLFLAGAGVNRGAVIGATDSKGARPTSRPGTPEDSGASFYHAFGIDPHTTYYPRITRPTTISSGAVIDGLFG